LANNIEPDHIARLFFYGLSTKYPEHFISSIATNTENLIPFQKVVEPGDIYWLFDNGASFGSYFGHDFELVMDQ